MHHITLIACSQQSAAKEFGGFGSFDSAKEFLYVLSDKEAPSNAIKFFAMMGAGAKEAAAEASGLSKVVKGIGGGIAGGWNALGAFGKIGLVIAALTAAYKLADHFIVTGEEAKAMMKESVSDYNNAANEVKELNSQLSENQRQIAAINSKGGLSFVEQGELEKLRQSTQYLKIQADLKQKEADRKAAEVGKAVESSYKKNNLSLVSEGKINEFKKAYQENNGIDIDNFASGDISKGIYLAKRLSEGTKDINGQVLALRAYKNILNDLQNTSDADPLDIENVKAQIDDIGGFLDQKILDYIDVIQAIESIPERLRTSNQNQILSDAKESLDFIYKETDPYKWNQMKLDDLFSRNDLADARAELVKMASSMKSVGITADDIKTKFPALANAARQAGIDIEDVVNDINSAAGVYDRDEALNYLKTSYKYADSIRNPQEAALAVAKYSDWVENLSEDDLSIVYSIAIKEDTSGWTLDDWKENLEVTKAAIADSIDTIQSDVQKAIDTQNNLTAALAAGNSATGMTAEQVKNVVDAFKDVEGFNIAELFENTATGVQMSADAFKRLNKNLQLKEQAKLLDAITAKMQEYNDAVTSGDESRIASATEDLIMLQAMLDEYNAATSKYNAYVTATSSANARDSYANVAAGYASVGQLIEDGWVTDDSVISYMELVRGDDWNKDAAGNILTTAEAYAKLGETIAGTSSSLKDYLATDSKGNLTSQGVWQFAEDVFSVFGNDGSGIASMENGLLTLDLTGEKLQTVAERFGTTTDMVMLFGQALSNAGMTVDFGSLADQIENIKGQIEQTKAEIEAAKEAEDWGALSAGNQKLDSQLKQQIRTAIQDAVQNGTPISEMLGLEDAKFADALGLDTSMENLGQYLDYARQQLQSLGQSTGEIPLNVKIDEGQFNAMIAALKPPLIEVEGDAKIEDVDASGIEGQNVEINATANVKSQGDSAESSVAQGAVNYTGDFSGVGSAPNLPGTVNYTGDFSGIGSAPTISGTAVYNVVFKGGGIGGGFFGGGNPADASGTMVSVAHADGTAYNVLNYTRLTPSHAGGQVALPSDEYALTNEVGRESIVRNGVWYMLPPGPHMEHLKKGDIIFNARQTADLINAGRTSTYARALSAGTLRALAGGTLTSGKTRGYAFVPWDIPSNATNSTSGGWKATATKNPWKDLTKRPSGGGGGDSDRGGGGGESSTPAYEDKDKIDWIEVAIKRIEESIKKLSHVMKSVFNDLATRLDATSKSIELTRKNLDTQTKGYDRYIEETKKVGLAEDIAEKVRNGEIDIAGYDEDTRKKITSYKKWYINALQM